MSQDPRLGKILDTLSEGTADVKRDPSEANYQQWEGRIRDAAKKPSDDWIILLVFIVIVVIGSLCFLSAAGASAFMKLSGIGGSGAAGQSYSFQTISLQGFSELTSPQTNLELGPGLVNLQGIPFDTGWTTNTQCSHIPNRPEEIDIATNIKRVTNVYILMQAGWGLKGYDKNEIGSINLFFADGKGIGTPLIMGFNIRDWAWKNPEAVNTTSSSMVQPGWQGPSPSGILGGIGGMDVLTIDIPSSISNRDLSYIQVLDRSYQLLGDINPCITLVAVTVKFEN